MFDTTVNIASATGLALPYRAAGPRTNTVAMMIKRINLAAGGGAHGPFA